jgi:hypothetical protein
MLYDSRPQCISVLSLKVVQRTRGALECDGCYTVVISRLIEKPQTSPVVVSATVGAANNLLQK